MTQHDTATPACSATRDAGATAIEYAIMASLIAVAIAGAVTLLGGAVIGLFASMPAGL